MKILKPRLSIISTDDEEQNNEKKNHLSYGWNVFIIPWCFRRNHEIKIKRQTLIKITRIEDVEKSNAMNGISKTRGYQQL